MDLDDDSEFLQRRPEAPQHIHLRRPLSPQQKHTSKFLGLPSELKLRIYDAILDSDRVDPPSAPYKGDHDTTQGEIKYPLRYRTWRWPPACWANKLLRNGLIDQAEERLKKRLARAELDIMVNGFVFFPTWLYLPPDIPYENGDPFDLDVSLRIFSGEAFRSNDSWPRQPGSGFRVLLKLLNQLVHEGPSFGKRMELLAGKVTWAINTLRVNVSFHDVYTPATHPAASHEIFRMLKALATSGLAHGIVKEIEAHVDYADPSKPGKTSWNARWPVAASFDESTASQWRSMGFLTRSQRTLLDDYRASYDPSSGAPLQRPQQLVLPGERRDSPFGVVAPAPKNPQQDDHGLITPPTPRTSVGLESASGSTIKARSSSHPPQSSSSNGYSNGDASTHLDDYGFATTPNMAPLLDDYSTAMTPMVVAPMDGDSDY